MAKTKITNLLPPSELEALKAQKNLSSIKTFSYLVLFAYVLTVAGLFAYRQYVQSTLSNLDTEITKIQAIVNKQDNNALKKQIVLQNAEVSDYNRLAKNNPQWSSVIAGFVSLVPSDVSIDTFAANTNTGEIDITGKSFTRTSIETLHDNIAASPLFKGIDLPFENLQKPTDVNYHFSFYLAKPFAPIEVGTIPVVAPPPSADSTDTTTGGN